MGRAEVVSDVPVGFWSNFGPETLVTALALRESNPTVPESEKSGSLP